MSQVTHLTKIEALIEERLKANQWTTESLAQWARYVIDGELESGHANDGVTVKIQSINEDLKQAFTAVAEIIKPEDIQVHLDKVVLGDIDWLAHLDIAFAMAHANPSSVTKEQTEQIRTMAEQKEKYPALLKLRAQAFADILTF